MLQDTVTTATLIKAYSSEVQCVVTMAGHGGMQTDMVLEKELRVLHIDPRKAQGVCVLSIV